MPRIQKKHPDWVYTHQPEKSAIHLINSTYYVYGVSSKWNAEKQKVQKITGALLGKVTPEGFIPSEKKKLKENLLAPHAVKSYGSTYLCLQLLEKELPQLQMVFPDFWQQIFMLAVLRFTHKAHLKMVPFYLQENYFTEKWGLKVSEKTYSDLLSALGAQREKIIQFKKSIFSGRNFLIADSTNVFSESRQLQINMPGYNSDHEYRPQVNLLYIFSAELMMPAYYRLIPGNIREVKAFRICIDESGIKDAVIVVDKGFYSENNILLLESERFEYIIPLRRNNKLIQYSDFRKMKQSEDAGFFSFQDRFIWYYRYKIQNKQITVYYDEQAKVNESQDYLSRITAEYDGYSLEEYHKKEQSFGTLSLLSNIKDIAPSDLYEHYKSRVNIEILFDAFKNILDADKTYMRDEESLEGWMFINFLAMRLYYSLYQHLRNAKLLARYSPADILTFAGAAKMIRINNVYRLSEIPSKVESVFHKLKLPIT